jgi:hypothetical protein
VDTIKKQVNIQIFASDIDNEALDFARMAAYPDSIAGDVSSETDSGNDCLCQSESHQRSTFFQIGPGKLPELTDLYGTCAAKKDFTAFSLHVNSKRNFISGHLREYRRIFTPLFSHKQNFHTSIQP